MKSLGLISEGITDQVVILNILYGYFDTNDVELTYLTPVRDETDQNRIVDGSGWYSVIEYVRSSKFNEAFQYLDFVVIQIDTDVCELPRYEVSRREEGIELAPLELREKVRVKLREWIGTDVFEARQNQIIFAIAVDSIECWLLPLYYENDAARRKKTVNCLGTLNEALRRSKGFTIDAKDPDYYDQASADYSKQRILRRLCRHNPSFNAFIDELDSHDFNSSE
jgi:hypothetical protein